MGLYSKKTISRKIGASKEFKLQYDVARGELNLYTWKGLPLLGYWHLVTRWDSVAAVLTPKVALNNIFKLTFHDTDTAMVVVLDDSYRRYTTYTNIADTPWIYQTADQGYLLLPRERTYPPEFVQVPYISMLHYGADGTVDTQTEVNVDSESILGNTMFNLPCPNGYATLALTIDSSIGHRYWSLAKELHLQLKQDGVTGEWHREVSALPPAHVTMDVLGWKPIAVALNKSEERPHGCK